MKKKIFILLTALCLGLVGCGSNNEINTSIAGNATPDTYGTFEWISPDGVHYWVVSGCNRYGIAPRYDSEGNLVIDDK